MSRSLLRQVKSSWQTLMRLLILRIQCLNPFFIRSSLPGKRFPQRKDWYGNMSQSLLHQVKSSWADFGTRGTFDPNVSIPSSSGQVFLAARKVQLKFMQSVIVSIPSSSGQVFLVGFCRAVARNSSAGLNPFFIRSSLPGLRMNQRSGPIC